MGTVTQMVHEFHVKHGFMVDENLRMQHNGVVTDNLRMLGQLLLEHSRRIRDDAIYFQQDQLMPDERLYRAHLLLEEVGETLDALAKCDEIALADALGDTDYVLHGVGAVYGIPVEAITEEVHRSNMTKRVRTADNLRMRDKGPDYSPPDIAGTLKRARAAMDWTQRLMGKE